MIHRKPQMKVVCPDNTCGARLIAKKLGATGTRFFATKPGTTCTHTWKPTHPTNERSRFGGGPEGDEHKWVKERLGRIGAELGLELVAEDTTSHGDVFLLGPQIVIEYQRWNTDFEGRSRARYEAGAKLTLWLLPDPQADPERYVPPGTKDAFDHAVFNQGAIYLAAKDYKDFEPLTPWTCPEQSARARLFASGSIVEFNSDYDALTRTSISMLSLLQEIIAGNRILEHTEVFSRRKARLRPSTVWVRRDDLHRAQRAARQRTLPVVEQHLPENSATNAPTTSDEPTAHSLQAANAPDRAAAPAPGLPATPVPPVELTIAQTLPTPGLTFSANTIPPSATATPTAEATSDAIASDPTTFFPLAETTPQLSAWAHIKAWLRRLRDGD